MSKGKNKRAKAERDGPARMKRKAYEAELRNLRWLVLVLVPLVPAIIGSAVWWKRRA